MSQMPSDILLEDLDTLYCAVSARLRGMADGSGEPTVAPAAALTIDAAGLLRAGVLDCVTALDQLHVMLAHEIERRHRLERILNEAQAVLARAPPELAATLGLSLHLPPTNRLQTRVPAPTRAAS